jgi:hypothetical protein
MRDGRIALPFLSERRACYPPYSPAKTVSTPPNPDYNSTLPPRQAKTRPRRFLAPKCAKTAIPFGEQRILGIGKYERGVLMLCLRSEAKGLSSGLRRGGAGGRGFCWNLLLDR